MQTRLSDAMRVGRSLEADMAVDQVPHRAIWRNVERTFNAVGDMPAGPKLREAVLGFINQGAVDNFVHLKRVCYGVTVPFNDAGERLIDRKGPLKRLLEAVDRHQDDGRRYRRCYQALMQGFFSLEPAVGTAKLDITGGAKVLRGYLSERLSLAARRTGGKDAPAWVLTLSEHRNLLGDQPCERYVVQLQKGKTDELSQVCDALGIGRDSWVWQAVVLAYLAEICNRPDTRFQAAVDDALGLAEGATAIQPSKPVSRLIVATLVRRYRQCSTHPEHAALRDAAVHRIGNPWLQRVQWDAWVDDEPTRQMVDSWLKSRLMEDFFTLLSDQVGGATDERRLNYWLRFVPAITDMWFVLGPAARRNHSPAFTEMRKRMAGRRLDLQGADDNNNAFVMHMGEHYFVEFGMKGNACYHYPEGEFPMNLGGRTALVHELKRGRSGRHSHVPSASWEREFDRKFCPLISYWPADTAGRERRAVPEVPRARATSAPSPRSINLGSARWRQEQIDDIVRRCAELDISVEDRRPKGGSLWIALRKPRHPDLRQQMEMCGFRYSDRHGQYYLSDD